MLYANSLKMQTIRVLQLRTTLIHFMILYKFQRRYFLRRFNKIASLEFV